MKERKKKLIKWGANEAVYVISMHAYFMPNQLFQIKTSNKCDKTTKKEPELLPPSIHKQQIKIEQLFAQKIYGNLSNFLITCFPNKLYWFCKDWQKRKTNEQKQNTKREIIINEGKSTKI